MAKTIYIKRLRALGDVVLTLPIVQHFLNAGHKVVLISQYTDVIRSTPGLRLQKRFNRLDKWLLSVYGRLSGGVQVLDLDNTYEQNPTASILENYRLCAGVDHVAHHATELLNISGAKTFGIHNKTILFHLQPPSVALPYRNVHGVDWKALADALEAKGYHCVELCDEGCKPILNEHIVPGLADLASIIESSAGYVGLDSGPAHIANALGKKALLFFGSVDPRLRLLSMDNVHIMQNACPHAGCYHSVPGTTGVACRLTEYDTPPCCTFETEAIISRALDVFK